MSNVRIFRFDSNSFIPRFASARQRGLVKLQTVRDVALLAQFVKFGHLLANVVAHVEFALRGHHLVVLLVLERLLAQGIVAHNFATLGLVFLNLRQTNDCGTVTALDTKRIDDFFDDTRGTPDFDVKMANRAVFVHHKPILDA